MIRMRCVRDTSTSIIFSSCAPTHLNDRPTLTTFCHDNVAPWTDVFGRYFNRVRGKPRFVSCLLYLNDEWDDKEWGAPTQFYDPPTEETYQVFPRPGRCVLMDQDVTHTVVAPNECAGNLPRYSLVWKLILHPRKEKQSMSLPTNISPVCVGSANAGGKV